MSDDDDEQDATILVFRNPATGRPVAVPQTLVEEAERPVRAYNRHVAGWTWKQIALEEGYLNAEAAKYDVEEYKREAVALVADRSRRDFLSLTLTRLEALQAAVWGQAMKGHLPAVNTARDLVMSQAKLLQLDQTAMAEDDIGAPSTVIIPHDEEGFSAALERLVD